MRTMNLEAVRRHLPEVVDEVVRKGTEVVVLRDELPVAKLVPFRQRADRRRLGGWEGLVHFAPDFG